MKHPRLFATLILTASLSIHLYADLALNSIVAAAAGIGTWLGTPSSANLLAALTDETGTGAAVFGTTPTFTTSVLLPATNTYTADATLARNTSDATDDGFMTLAGGGAFTLGTYTRGAAFWAAGNEHATQPGRAYASIGNVAGGEFIVTANGVSVFRVLNAGTIFMPSISAGAAGDTDACLGSATNELTDAGASTCIVSSMRFKDWLQNLNPDESLAKVLRLTPGVYRYKPSLYPAAVSGHERVGFTAENMAAVEPRLAFFESNGTPLTVNFEETTALLASAIQALQAENEALRVRMAILEAQ